ncbi:hydantoinase B/oxoprolinase family protein [Frigidibacter sp. MR17.24]|uniref:hydantoinase B/oxoprolinase family protein n=1 Tax=Frigidibacter sp. MR17.24 TaxID=3127345 RepID=UPI003012E9A3
MSPKDLTKIDPVMASVIQGALQNIAVEMGHKLMRMAYSSIIRESEDFGAALTDAEGLQIAETTQSTPLQCGPIPGYVRDVLARIAERGDIIRDGDVILHNDPYGGASHGPDIAVIVPMFHEGTLVGFSCTTAHHLDVGALTPGSAGIVDAIDVFAEGLQMKALKFHDAGRRNDVAWQFLRDNVRAPDMVVGDLEAQVAACRIGAGRFAELIGRYGVEAIRAAAADLMDYSERLMRQAIAALPDGTYRAETMLDGFLDDPAEHRRDLPVVVTLTVTGDELMVDLEGTAPQVEDRPVNMPFVGTTDIAVWLAVRSILLDSDTYGYIPQNSGLTRPITIRAPKGCLANPIFPAPVIARFTGGLQLSNTVMKALAQAAPRLVSAGVGNLKVISFSGLRDTGHWVHMEIFEGSYGGRFGKDGLDAVDTLYANTRNNPIEDIESHLPLRVTRYELNDAGRPGAGKWRGGYGSIREFAFLETGGASVEGDGHKYRPWGFDGGTEGATAALDLVDAAGTVRSMPSKIPYTRVGKGGVFRATGPAGGGYGDPFERDPALVREDLLDGLLSAEAAAEDYGVVISASGEIDLPATQARRTRA